MVNYTPYFFIIFSAILGAIGQFFFKMAQGNYFSAYFFVGIALYGIATLIYVYFLKYLPLSIGYPLIATSYIFVMLLSHFFLKENITIYKILGTFLILFGIYLINKT